MELSPAGCFPRCIYVTRQDVGVNSLCVEFRVESESPAKSKDQMVDVPARNLDVVNPAPDVPPSLRLLQSSRVSSSPMEPANCQTAPV